METVQGLEMVEEKIKYKKEYNFCKISHEFCKQYVSSK
jgi:hypothetical protein